MIPSLTIIITYHNNQGFLTALLRSIASNIESEIVKKVIVVDSDSIKPPSLPESFPVPIDVLYNAKGSLTSSLNLGLTNVRTSWACILDCDTEIESSLLWNIVKQASDRNIKVAIPLSVYPNKKQQECFDTLDTVLLGYILSGRFMAYLLKPYYRSKEILSLPSTESFSVSFFWNQCVFVDMSIIEHFHYSESLHVWPCDFELSQRLTRMNQKIMCFPDYRIIHYGEGSGNHDDIVRMKAVLMGQFAYVNLAYPQASLPIHILALILRALRLLLRITFLQTSLKINCDKTLVKIHLKLLYSLVLRNAHKLWPA
jgi:glycosyltransferase involved in cell wall biosynthesis